VALGYQAGFAGTANTTGSNNTYIGYQSQSNANNYSTSTAIGSGAIITASNTIVLGTANETVRYNKVSPLYSSIPTFASTDIGYKVDATLSGTTAITTSPITVHSISIPGVGVWSMYFTAASINASAASRITFKLLNSGGTTLVNNYVFVNATALFTSSSISYIYSGSATSFTTTIETSTGTNTLSTAPQSTYGYALRIA
jgi:hypothetical protein